MLRITVPRIAALLALALMVGYTFVLAPRLSRNHDQDPYAFAGSAPTAKPSWLTAALALPPPTPTPAPGTPGATPSATATPGPPPAPRFPSAGTAFTGIMTKPGPYDLGPLDEFATAVKHQPNVLEFSVGWWDRKFDRRVFDTVAERGIMPMVAWEPWDYRKEAKEDKLRGLQPEYSLAHIVDGTFDDYIKAWAQGIKDLGYPVALRFAHEMNGYWYPWCEQTNGNQKGQYVQAWKHVHDIFKQAGATRVAWVWSPNVDYENATTLSTLYPGDDYVDWLGLSGYYGTTGVEKYKSFDQIFGPTIAQLRGFSQKPVVITETGATDTSGLKAQWITEMFSQLAQHPDIIGVIWYESRKEVDWRVSVSPAASEAFANGVSAPRYNTSWTVHSEPTLTVPPPPAPAPAPTTDPPAPPAPTTKPPTKKPTPTATRPKTPTSDG
ncbi:glycoside hydrolase family 26 protein [Streptomyces sp. NRRL WC-3742]|uniref:glycoside hydrolase family 26 protein n=1 Tax=Streptomyces sp. NRRL WC-3742 TaxID=1463934 RepID=UPI0007C446EF|nr:glycosyl hydrolase [Streptomyces sp. NRRL WC-3742]